MCAFVVGHGVKKYGKYKLVDKYFVESMNLRNGVEIWKVEK